MKTLGDRIRLLMTNSGLGVSEIATIAGIKPPSVSDWLNGKTKTMKAGPALRLSKHFAVNSLWLTEDTGPMRDRSITKANDEHSSQEPTPQPYAALPVSKTKRQLGLDEVARLAALLNDLGLERLIGMASVLVEDFPIDAKQTRRSSQ